jgi:hypothetical protein
MFVTASRTMHADKEMFTHFFSHVAYIVVSSILLRCAFVYSLCLGSQTDSSCTVLKVASTPIALLLEKGAQAYLKKGLMFSNLLGNGKQVRRIP